MQRLIHTRGTEPCSCLGHPLLRLSLVGPVGGIALLVATVCGPPAIADGVGLADDPEFASAHLLDFQDDPQPDDPWGEEEWDEFEEDTGRSFLYKELVISSSYSLDGVAGIPPDDSSEDHFDLSIRPPGSYVGLDWVATFSPNSEINKDFLPDWLPLTALDFHPRIVYDQMETKDGLSKLKFAPQDFWLKFNPGGADRVSLRIGQFVIPYGVNPILAPRQQFILPVEATDLGLKWDWGVDLKGPVGDYDWEIAATIGSGEGLHSPHLFQSDSERTSYLLTGRIGTPTYWDFQYGASFLYGDIPVIRGVNVFGDVSIARWRVALDTFYKYGTYLMVGGQITYGQDGIGDDKQYIMITGGETADVLGGRAWMDWVLPANNDIRFRGQIETVFRDLSTSKSDDTAAIFEVGYSLTQSISLVLDYRIELNSSRGMENDAIYFSFIYYGL